MKRFISLLVVALLSLSTTASAREVAIPEHWEGLATVEGECFCQQHLNQTALVIPGDVDNNQNINAADALLILQCAVNPTVTYNRFKKAGACISRYATDINQDDKVNANDALLILQYAVDKIDTLGGAPAIPSFTLYQQPDWDIPVSPTDA